MSLSVYLRTRPGECKHLAQSSACCLLRAMTDGKGAYSSNTSIFDCAASCLPKIACTPRPYMCRPPACAWRGIMYLGHTIRAAGSLLLLTSRPITASGTRPLFQSPDSPCISPSSTVNVSSTFSPSWTRTAARVCPWPVVSCERSSWTPDSGTFFTSAPRVSWGGTTSFWDPRCGTWLFAGTPAGSCKCATLRTGWRPRFRRTSAVNMRAWSALSWPMSATCECLCVVVVCFENRLKNCFLWSALKETRRGWTKQRRCFTVVVTGLGLGLLKQNNVYLWPAVTRVTSSARDSAEFTLLYLNHLWSPRK